MLFTGPTGTEPTGFVDGHPPECRCGRDCEMPCWQRVGLTSQPCCKGCPPLPDPKDL